MLDLWTGIILGAIQGITEFLPISSSGHLILAREFFGFSPENGLAIDAVLQLATILAVGIYFRKELLDLLFSFIKVILNVPLESEKKTLLFAVILGTIPAMIVGLLLQDQMETIFRSSALVALMLIVGSLIFVLAEKMSTGRSPLTVGKGFVVGLFQVLALIPGVSRSGITISGGLILGLTREAAARFSFILSFPIILGSGLLKLFELQQEHLLQALGIPLIASFVTSFIVGILAIHYLIKYLRNHTLYIFVWYRLILASIIFIALYIR